MKKQTKVTKQTRERIINAFWELYENEKIEKISIAALSKKANINRSTFYEYFADIYELLDEVEEEILEETAAKMEENLHKLTDDSRKTGEILDIHMLGRTFAQIFSAQEDRIFILLSKNGDPVFQKKMQSVTVQHLMRIMPNSDTDENMEYLAVYIVSSLMGIFSHWYETGKKKDVEELIVTTARVIGTGIFGYLDYSVAEYAAKF